ncbi:TPA: hypothetical protein ACRM4C_002627, partial [Pseudomonas aeruginosa]
RPGRICCKLAISPWQKPLDAGILADLAAFVGSARP